jgi:23S rRNA U2552 (ribose-2'-O)-methylase RlmE/FtsJ
MVKYNLDHLTQPENQKVAGPIQDDEALFLYSIIRGSRLSRILEIGGLNGYSSKNFLRALDYGINGVLYTCDINPVQKLETNHVIITKNVTDLTTHDVDNKPLDLIFFDCHTMLQMNMYYNFKKDRIIDDNTIIALHDTNLHYQYPSFQPGGKFIKRENGYAHQPVEREMVNIFKTLGYDIFSISTNKTKHDINLPFRHGVTICKKFKRLF